MPDFEEMTFRRYRGLARLVKYGNMYKIKDDRDFTFWSSKGDHVPLAFTHEDEIQWLISQGLADLAEHDPVLALGKVVPTDKAQNRLENHELTVTSPGVGVHLSHCCLERHGCKYGDEFCPVATKMFPPSSTCGACYEDDEMDDETVNLLSDTCLINELVGRGYTVTEKPKA